MSSNRHERPNERTEGEFSEQELVNALLQREAMEALASEGPEPGDEAIGLRMEAYAAAHPHPFQAVDSSPTLLSTMPQDPVPTPWTPTRRPVRHPMLSWTLSWGAAAASVAAAALVVVLVRDSRTKSAEDGEPSNPPGPREAEYLASDEVLGLNGLNLVWNDPEYSGSYLLEVFDLGGQGTGAPVFSERVDGDRWTFESALPQQLRIVLSRPDLLGLGGRVEFTREP